MTAPPIKFDPFWRNSQDMLGVADGRGVWLSVNPVWEGVLGWDAAEIVGRTSEWMEHPDDWAKTRQEVRDLVAGGKTLNFENRFRTKAGDYRTLSWTAASEDGLLFCTARDVTNMRAQATALADQATTRDRTWAFTPDLLSVIDLTTGAFDKVNPAWSAALGWSMQEIEGVPFADFLHPSDLVASAEAFEQVRRGDPVIRFENRYRTKVGDWRWLSWVALPESGKLYSSTRDVTMDRARDASLRLYEHIVQSDASPICAYDTRYRVIAFNQAHDDDYARVMGRRAEVGEVLPDAFAPEQAAALRGLIDRALSGESFHVEADFGDADMSVPHWELDFAPIRDERGQLIGAFHHARDITTRLKMETDLATAEEGMRQAQKMEAVGQLTGGVAHDFNNLLTVIRGSVELLKRPGLSEERRGRYIDAIGDTADRASKLTAQLLAFSRRQALKPETFNVTDSIDHVGNIVRTLIGSRIDLQVIRPAIPLVVTTDRGQFDTAIVNIAVNARDAMKGEGRLTIRVGAVSNIPERRAHPIMVGDFVAVAITDTGTGISAEDLVRVFEPFFTTKGVGHGTGLGLSQVIGFAKQAGGDVRVESKVGEGSTFTVYLPRVYEEADRPKDAAEPNIGGDGVCVLVVEDNDSVGDFATEALLELGYDSVLARNATEALNELAKDCARFHVVFSDVVMPGMSGLELAEVIRRDYPNTPIVLTSGYSHVLSQNGQHGFELLHKPYSVEQLSRVLRKAIAWRQSLEGKLPA